MNAQRLQNRADVNLDSSLGERQIAADQLVGLSLDEKLQHVGLSSGESQRIGREVDPVAVGNRKAFRRPIDAAVEHASHGVQ